jgi:flagellar basal-body rod protein FlgB
MFNKISSSSKIIEKALDASSLRNEAIAQNIANIDTPGYKRKIVEFERYLADALESSRIRGRTTDSRHIPIGGYDADRVQIKLTQDNKSLSYRLDGNNVDVDNEMASLAKNTIKYNTLIQSINAGFRRLKTVINEGRR